MNKLFAYLFFLSCVLAIFSCRKEFSFEKANIQAAEGSLWDSSGACLPDTVYGTFYTGILSGSDTAYVEIQVNVTQTGSYNIQSDNQNGFNFADSGFFASTGINKIRLKQVGLPIIPTTSIFNINFDSTYCSFAVTVLDSTGTGLGGGGDTTGIPIDSNSWKFTTADGTFDGTFGTAVIMSDSTAWASGGQMLYMDGFTSTSIDTAIALYLFLPTGVITPGAYSTQSFPPENSALFAFIDFDLSTGDGEPIYQALPSSAEGTNVIVNITSYDSATRIIKGTFSGKATDANDVANVDVIDGTFTAKVAP